MILVQLDIKIKGSVSHYATKICMGGSENHECQNCFCNVVKSPKNKPVTRELNWVLGDLIQYCVLLVKGSLKYCQVEQGIFCVVHPGVLKCQMSDKKNLKMISLVF